jgi:GNAT superfamily N-acetyltransferase
MERSRSKENYMNIVVEKAKEEDIKDIQEMCHTLMTHVKQWSPTLDENWILGEEGEEYIRSSITGEDGTVLKAVVDNKPAGFVLGSTREKPYRLERKFAEIDFFYVNSDYRRHGVGTSLMDGLSSWCKEKDVKVLLVETTYNNVDGQAFYRTKGFHNQELVLEKEIE